MPRRGSDTAGCRATPHLKVHLLGVCADAAFIPLRRAHFCLDNAFPICQRIPHRRAPQAGCCVSLRLRFCALRTPPAALTPRRNCTTTTYYHTCRIPAHAPGALPPLLLHATCHLSTCRASLSTCRFSLLPPNLFSCHRSAWAFATRFSPCAAALAPGYRLCGTSTASFVSARVGTGARATYLPRTWTRTRLTHHELPF